MTWPHSPWLVILDALMALRLTRLIIADTLPPVARAREWALARWPGEWGAGLVCFWCAGFWVAILVVVGHTLAELAGVGAWWVLVAAVFAVSAVVGLLGERTG